jgi:biopolymer transport protein ExbD
LKFKRRFRDEDEPVPTASMADISTLLIIFFMITTVFAVDSGLVVELPATATRERVDLREIIVTVTAGGEVHADGKPIEVSALGAYVTSKRQANPRRPVVVRSDRNVAYGKVADVMDELFLAGVRDVALPTAAEVGK